MIEISHIQKKYGEKYAIEDLSFTMEDGKIYGLLGTNGAGKSTTMNIVCGYLRADAGTVKINGYDMLTSPEQAKRQIGYLPEIPPVYMDMTVREYLTFAAQLKGLKGRAVQGEVERVMEITQIKPMYRRLARNLSKGYRQRLGLAAALLGDPKILILDEPMVGLDPLQIAQMREFIMSLGGSHTVLLSSHILSEIEAACEEVIILREGHVIAQGPIRQIEENAARNRRYRVTVKAQLPALEALLCEKKPDWVLEDAAEADGVVTGVLKSTGPQDVREALFYLLAEHRMPILALSVQAETLEKAFMELMKEDEHL